METCFESYFELIYRKITRKKIKFNKTKIIYKKMNWKLPLWIQFLIRENDVKSYKIRKNAL